MKAEGQALHVLVADDHPDAARSLVLLLHLGVHKPVTTAVALNGQQAVHLAQEQAPDVAVLDIEMSLANGVEVAIQLRQLFGAGIRLIALSGRPQHVVTALEGSLFDHALSKPVDTTVLFQVVSSAAADPAAA